MKIALLVTLFAVAASASPTWGGHHKPQRPHKPEKPQVSSTPPPTSVCSYECGGGWCRNEIFNWTSYKKTGRWKRGRSYGASKHRCSYSGGRSPWEISRQCYDCLCRNGYDVRDGLADDYRRVCA